MTAQRRYSRRWVQICGIPALPLPNGRYGAPMIVAGAMCPCESDAAECVCAAVFEGDPADGGLGYWLDLARNWHQTSERSARLALESEFPAEPDINDVRKADAA